jgi:hypothetical protein
MPPGQARPQQPQRLVANAVPGNLSAMIAQARQELDKLPFIPEPGAAAQPFGRPAAPAPRVARPMGRVAGPPRAAADPARAQYVQLQRHYRKLLREHVKPNALDQSDIETVKETASHYRDAEKLRRKSKRTNGTNDQMWENDKKEIELRMVMVHLDKAGNGSGDADWDLIPELNAPLVNVGAV